MFQSVIQTDKPFNLELWQLLFVYGRMCGTLQVNIFDMKYNTDLPGDMDLAPVNNGIS